jgi:phosphomannomutase
MTDFSKIFKAYDVRGIYGQELDVNSAKRIGQAYATVRRPKRVAVGQDVRAHGQELKAALIEGLISSGIDVVDIGIITTDQLYFTVGNYGFDGGISVTASHNPSEYNGFKFSEKGGSPIGSEDLIALRDWAASAAEAKTDPAGQLSTLAFLDDYVKHVLGYIDTSAIKPLRLVANANFGAVGRSVDRIADKLQLNLQKLNWQEDGSFPKGPPNPLLPENRQETIELIKQVKPDFGVAWDADADRVFFFTGSGVFVSSAFIIALLAPKFLKQYPGANIVHDLTTAWVMDEAIKANGGVPVRHRTGHTFIKARMREVDAPFGGESSGHYYFKKSFYADNGIVPFLMILEMVSKSGTSLDEIIKPLMDRHKLSGEINFTVKDASTILNSIEQKYASAGKVDKTDGLVIETEPWRISVRTSNTEPLLRLNAESKSQAELDHIVQDVQAIIESQA